MSRAQMARLFISQRLSAAAEDIFRLFEGIITEYEEQIYLQKKTLDEWTDKTQTDCLQLPVYKEEVPPGQQERNPILDLGEEPKTPQIKEEQEEHKEEASGVKLTLTFQKHESSLLSTELQAEQEEEEKSATPPSTSTEQMKTEPDGEDCGVAGPASVLDLTADFEPVADVQLQNSDDTNTSFSDRTSLKEIVQSHSGSRTLNPGQITDGHTWSNRNHFQSPTEMSDELELLDHAYSSLCCKVCRKSFLNKRVLIYHVKAHPRDCGLCGRHLEPRESLEGHLSAHKKCSVCGKRFSSVTLVERHMRSHTGERPFCCPVCGKSFRQKGTMTNHLITHTGVKPFGCVICSKRFCEKRNLENHIRLHTGEKPYSCSSCGKRFNRMAYLKRHKCLA